MIAAAILLSVAGVVALGTQFGYLRAVIAFLMGAAILLWGVRRVRKLLQFPPEDEVADVSAYGLKYVCTMCGLELKVETAARDKAPTHCMEPMVLMREGGKPPLRPV